MTTIRDTVGHYAQRGMMDYSPPVPMRELVAMLAERDALYAALEEALVANNTTDVDTSAAEDYPRPMGVKRVSELDEALYGVGEYVIAVDIPEHEPPPTLGDLVNTLVSLAMKKLVRLAGYALLLLAGLFLASYVIFTLVTPKLP